MVGMDKLVLMVFSPSVDIVRGLRLNRYAGTFVDYVGVRLDCVFRSLKGSCCHRESVEGYYDLYGGPSPDKVFYHLNGLDMDYVACLCNELLAASAREAKEKGLLEGDFALAVDLNDVPYWGVPDDSCVRYKCDGTNNVHRYAVVSAVGKQFFFSLYALPVTTGMSVESIVRKLVSEASKYVSVDVILMDRGFFKVDVFNAIEELGFKYVVPAKMTANVKKIVAKAEETGKLDWRHKVLKKSTREQKEVMLYLQDDPEHGWIGIITNKRIAPENITRLFTEYLKRWNIENNFKSKNYYKAETCSKNPCYRLLLYTLSLLLVNIWQILKNTDTKRPFRKRHLKKILETMEEQETMRIVEHRNMANA